MHHKAPKVFHRYVYTQYFAVFYQSSEAVILRHYSLKIFPSATTLNPIGSCQTFRFNVDVTKHEITNNVCCHGSQSYSIFNRTAIYSEHQLKIWLVHHIMQSYNFRRCVIQYRSQNTFMVLIWSLEFYKVSCVKQLLCSTHGHGHRKYVEDQVKTKVNRVESVFLRPSPLSECYCTATHVCC